LFFEAETLPESVRCRILTPRFILVPYVYPRGVCSEFF